MLNDDSIMPFGKYKGEKLGDVPADYLLWLYENDRCDRKVKSYVEENMDVIKIEIQRNKNGKRFY